MKMKAPRGTTSANIEGHQYEIDSDGIITVINENHVPTLVRHGFVESVSDDPEDYDIDAMDKEELTAFIEERGGDADGLTKKQLKALANKLIED